MKLKSIALAAALVASSACSFATTHNLGTVTGTVGFSATVLAGSFDDFWTFDTTSVLSSSSITNSRVGTSNNITSFEAWLDGTALNFASNGATKTLYLEDLPLLAGTHTLEIKGIASVGGASYGGNVAVQAVPEPETYAMLLAGLGLMGGIARRRANKAA